MYDSFLIFNEPLSKHSTIKIGGLAKYFFSPHNFSECLQAFEFAEKHRFHFCILGNGSNTLFSSKDFNGVIINTKNLKNFYIYNFKFRKISTKKHFKISISSKNKTTKIVVKENGSFKVANPNDLPLSFKICIKNGNKLLLKTCVQNVHSMIKIGYKIVRAYSGMQLPLLSNLMSNSGNSGLEFACSIPATLGGAVKMNAGAFGGQMQDVVYRVLVYNLQSKQIYYKYNEKLSDLGKIANNYFKMSFYKKRYFINSHFLNNVNNLQSGDFQGDKNDEIHKTDVDLWKRHFKRKIFKCVERKLFNLYFDYRYSGVLDEEFIIAVDFVLRKGNLQQIKQKVQDNVRKRLATQNVGFPSLGSVFKRSGEFLPALAIDKLALKGLRVGDAMVSTQHSGYIVNVGNAKSQDVCKLLKILQHIICKNYNIMVKYEIKKVGEFNEQ